MSEGAKQTSRTDAKNVIADWRSLFQIFIGIDIIGSLFLPRQSRLTWLRADIAYSPNMALASLVLPYDHETKLKEFDVVQPGLSSIQLTEISLLSSPAASRAIEATSSFGRERRIDDGSAHTCTKSREPRRYIRQRG